MMLLLLLLIFALSLSLSLSLMSAESLFPFKYFVQNTTSIRDNLRQTLQGFSSAS